MVKLVKEPVKRKVDPLWLKSSSAFSVSAQVLYIYIRNLQFWIRYMEICVIPIINAHVLLLESIFMHSMLNQKEVI